MKDTVEAVLALVALEKFLAVQFKNGVQLSDGTALLSKLIGDAEFRLILLNGITGLGNIRAELAKFNQDKLGELLVAVGTALKTEPAV